MRDRGSMKGRVLSMKSDFLNCKHISFLVLRSQSLIFYGEIRFGVKRVGNMVPQSCTHYTVLLPE